ncbi:MAG: HAD family hydrolase [Candidatus Helarchaeota archaeon]
MSLKNKILNNRIKGFIFDLDGTLINTLKYHVQAFLKAFNESSYTIDKKIIEQNMGRTPWDIPSDILFNKNFNSLGGTEKKVVKKIASKKIKYYHEFLEGDIPVQNGAIKLLKYFKSNNYKLAVCSSTPQINVNYILKKVKLFDFFDVIITGDNIKIGKPNPAAYLLAVNHLHLKKEECIIIGDSIHDIKAGKNGGIMCISVCTGFHSKDQLKSEAPDLLVNDLEELYSIIS